jgi:glycolate oxidase
MEKQAYMPLIFSADDLNVMARVRSAVDPSGKFNPDKVLPTSGNGHAPQGAGGHRRMPEGMWV